MSASEQPGWRPNVGNGDTADSSGIAGNGPHRAASGNSSLLRRRTSPRRIAAG